MRTIRNSYYNVVVLIGLSLAAHGSTQSSKTCTVTPAELEVYRTYFQALREPVVLVSETEGGPAREIDSLNLALATHGQGTPKDLREDFKTKNERDCAIPAMAKFRNVRVITAREADAIFRSHDGWKAFHRRFGEKSSLDNVSRVGFNAAGTLAMLHVSSGISSMGGGGELFVYELKKGKWVKKSYMPTWAT